MYLLIDNYDSFTFNLVHYMGEAGAQFDVVRNDAISAEQALERGAEGIVVSPGPCTPNEAGICVELIRAAAGRLPILGVCLGHQSIGQAFGAKVVRAPLAMHGKLSWISHTGQGVFADLPNPFEATRYHSLIVERATLPDCFEITAETEDGIIMGMQHRDHAIHGIQFHPESIATEHGRALLRNFLDIAGHDRGLAA